MQPACSQEGEYLFFWETARAPTKFCRHDLEHARLYLLCMIVNEIDVNLASCFLFTDLKILFADCVLKCTAQFWGKCMFEGPTVREHETHWPVMIVFFLYRLFDKNILGNVGKCAVGRKQTRHRRKNFQVQVAKREAKEIVRQHETDAENHPKKPHLFIRSQPWTDRPHDPCLRGTNDQSITPDLWPGILHTTGGHRNIQPKKGRDQNTKSISLAGSTSWWEPPPWTGRHCYSVIILYLAIIILTNSS